MSNFELNKGDQFIVGLDISGSMRTPDCAGATRFAHVLETMKVFIGQAAKWDPDGVSFYAFNESVKEFRDVSSVDEINSTIGTLKPGGGTATHLAIKAAYAEHKEKANEQTFFLLFTDGEPSDSEAVKQAVIDISNEVKDPLEFRISILTVGERTPALDVWLNDLDNNLTGAKHDIVDIRKLEEIDFEQAVVHAIGD